mmetsp:Transcript_2095/g.4769  ORF Transcript_2095/g.4769 Transcript_2095/m.4769 type:complete len:244 (+) Transcript_2095:472-1203(+)
MDEGLLSASCRQHQGGVAQGVGRIYRSLMLQEQGRKGCAVGAHSQLQWGPAAFVHCDERFRAKLSGQVLGHLAALVASLGEQVQGQWLLHFLLLLLLPLWKNDKRLLLRRSHSRHHQGLLFGPGELSLNVLAACPLLSRNAGRRRQGGFGPFGCSGGDRSGRGQDFNRLDHNLCWTWAALLFYHGLGLWHLQEFLIPKPGQRSRGLKKRLCHLDVAPYHSRKQNRATVLVQDIHVGLASVQCP